MEGITNDYGQYSGRTRILNYRDQMCLTKTVCDNPQATLRLKSGSHSIQEVPDAYQSKSVQRSLSSIGYGSKRLTRVSLLTTRHWIQRFTWARDIALEDC